MTKTCNIGFDTQGVSIPADGVLLQGDLTVPAGAHGIIVFAHGSGSSRLSPRNQMVAKWLQTGGFGTLLFDLLTQREEAKETISSGRRFDIDFLASRLGAATDWLESHMAAEGLRLGYFGASTGAAAALVAAARRPRLVGAIVSRGGRPDLAGPFLSEVTAPTLLLVGGADPTVLVLNQRALGQLGCASKELLVIPGASHLFEEPGRLEQVAELARRWFARYLGTDEGDRG